MTTGSPWVSVKDRLPENDVTILVATRYDYVVAAGWNGTFRACGEYDCDSDIRGVTHWMEIPPVPCETDLTA